VVSLSSASISFRKASSSSLNSVGIGLPSARAWSNRNKYLWLGYNKTTRSSHGYRDVDGDKLKTRSRSYLTNLPFLLVFFSLLAFQALAIEILSSLSGNLSDLLHPDATQFVRSDLIRQDKKQSQTINMYMYVCISFSSASCAWSNAKMGVLCESMTVLWLKLKLIVRTLSTIDRYLNELMKIRAFTDI